MNNKRMKFEYTIKSRLLSLIILHLKCWVCFGNVMPYAPIDLSPRTSAIVWEKYGSAEKYKHTSEWYEGLVMAIARDGRNLAVSAETIKVFSIDGSLENIESSDWIQIGEEIPRSSNSDARIALADHASRIVIGESGVKGVNGIESGRVKVMEFNGETWDQVGQTIDGEGSRDRFGDSVSITSDGSKIAIGAWKNKGSGDSDIIERQGEVCVYEYDGASWVQFGQHMYSSNDYGRRFGWDIDLSASGSRIVVGSPLSGRHSSWNGTVAVHDFKDNTWTQVGQRIKGLENSRFGSSVAISADGTTIVVGAPFAELSTTTGLVRVYKFDGSSWVKTGQDIIGGGVNVAISANGLRIAVGTRGSASRITDLGMVHGKSCAKVYDLVNGETWVQAGEDFDGWGGSISMSADGSRVAMAYYNDHFHARTFRDMSYASSPNFPHPRITCEKVGQQWCNPAGTGDSASDYSTHYVICSAGEGDTLKEIVMPVAPGTKCCTNPFDPSMIVLQHKNINCVYDLNDDAGVMRHLGSVGSEATSGSVGGRLQPYYSTSKMIMAAVVATALLSELGW